MFLVEKQKEYQNVKVPSSQHFQVKKDNVQDWIDAEPINFVDPEFEISLSPLN